MENDSEDIRAIGKKMMGGLESPKSSTENSDSKGMFEMPSFGEEATPQAKQGCSCGHDAPQKQPKPDNMFGNFGNLGGESKPAKSADDMFGGGFGGMGSNDDAEKLKKLGQSMMGQ